MLNRIVPSRYDAPTLPASFLRPKSYATDAMSMSLSGKEISSRATALPSGKGGAYGLVHPDGSKCDAKTPDTCRKFPHKEMEVANPQAKGGGAAGNAENPPVENKGESENTAPKPTENGSQSAPTNTKPTNPTPAPQKQSKAEMHADAKLNIAMGMTEAKIDAFIQSCTKKYTAEELASVNLKEVLSGKGFLDSKNSMLGLQATIAEAETIEEKRDIARRFFASLTKDKTDFVTQLGAAIDAAKAVAKKAKELESKITEPTVSGVLSEDQKQKCLEETKRANKAFKDVGIETFVSEVERNPFDTTLIFKHDGPLSPTERGNLASKLGVDPTIIPDKVYNGRADTFAITIPHEKVADVAFSDMMKDKELNEKAADLNTPVALGVGKDGKGVVHSLAKMIHLLIGGETGKGKSSVLNSILTSLLKWSSPDDTELYLIDPKGTELSAYKDMPHVKQSILGNDPEAVVKMLDESIAEMRNRNEFFASLKKTHGAIIKDLDGYNNYRLMHSELNLPPMKRRIICIEEAANFAKDAKIKKEVFSRIALLAEQSRSAGMNLIVTTQDPKIETVGDIKANFPTRIALKTSDQTKSRNILDADGADKLTGRGDMLVKTDEGLERVKGAFINDKQETAGEPSELDKELEAIKEKYPKPEPEPAPEPKPEPKPEGGEGGGEGDGAGGGEPPKPEPPKPEGGENGGEDDNGEKPTLPNSHGPVDISHLGFFKAIKAAVVYGANGQSITYDPAAYNRMGAEKWKKHLAEVRGEGKEPDYSTHRLNEIYPLSPKASNTQKEMFKKWCAKFNSACENPDPMVAHRVKKQYLAWLKDEGLTDNPDDGTAPRTNPYIDALNKGKESGGGDGGSTGGSAAPASA